MYLPYIKSTTWGSKAPIIPITDTNCPREYSLWQRDPLKRLSQQISKVVAKLRECSCVTTAYTQTRKEYCLESILFRNKTNGCSLMIKGKTDHCKYHIGRGGILISGCSEVFKVISINNLEIEEKEPIPPNMVLFYPHASNRKLKINGRLIKARSTSFLELKIKSTGVIRELDPVLIDLIPKDMDELTSYNKTARYY